MALSMKAVEYFAAATPGVAAPANNLANTQNNCCKIAWFATTYSAQARHNTAAVAG
jgi:hypothetical protein